MPLTTGQETYERLETVKDYRVRNLPSDPDSTFRSQEIVIYWQQPDPQLNNLDYVGFDSPTFVGQTAANSNRFVQLKDSYKEYAITGCSFEWSPTSVVAVHGDNQDLQVTNVWYYSQPKLNVVNDTSEGNILQNVNLQRRDPKKRFYQYINFRKYSATEQIKWALCEDYQPQLQNMLTQASTTLRVFQNVPKQGVSDESVTFGWLRVKHYIVFRGQRDNYTPPDPPV